MNELMRRRRALMGAKNGLPILNPAIGYTENYMMDTSNNNPPYMVSKTGAAATDFIDAGTSGNFIYYNPSTPSLWYLPTSPICGRIIQYAGNAENQTRTDYWNCYMDGTERNFALSENKRFVRLNLPMENLSKVYAYNSATGQVYYAGKDTPYYGKTNIND